MCPPPLAFVYVLVDHPIHVRWMKLIFLVLHSKSCPFYALQWDSLGVQAHDSFWRYYLRVPMSGTVVLYGKLYLFWQYFCSWSASVQKFLSVIQNDVFLQLEVMLVMCILRFQLRERQASWLKLLGAIFQSKSVGCVYGFGRHIFKQTAATLLGSHSKSQAEYAYCMFWITGRIICASIWSWVCFISND